MNLNPPPMLSNAMTNGMRAIALAAALLAVADMSKANHSGPSLEAGAKTESSSSTDAVRVVRDEGTVFANGPLDGTVSESRQVLRPGIGSANAWAYAGYGVLGATANVTATIQPSSVTPTLQSGASARAYARFSDVLRVDVPGRAGEVGSLVVPWSFTGGWGGGLTGPSPRDDSQNASINWQLGIFSNFGDSPDVIGSATQAFGDFEAYWGEQDIYAESNHTLTLNYKPPELVVDSQSSSAVVPPLWSEILVIFGRPMRLDAELRIDASAEVSNVPLDSDDPNYLQMRTAEANGDFSHTLRWGGVQQVLGADGNAITGWAISADSGTDYAVANITTVVPEPATWLSLLFGLIAMAPRLTRRGKRSAR